MIAMGFGALTAVADVRGVARVIDGDTLDIAGTRVRLFGIDAPEMAQTCPDWACGVWSRDMLEALTEGRVTCIGDEFDRYGRLLARCDAGQGDIGAAMVEGGAATAFRRYAMDYVGQEARARAARRGIWRHDGDGLTSPADYRSAQRSPVIEHSAAPNGCAIKGNISANGRIYHRPGQRDYDRTTIDATRGERWFCSESQALAAGWRAALR